MTTISAPDSATKRTTSAGDGLPTQRLKVAIRSVPEGAAADAYSIGAANSAALTASTVPADPSDPLPPPPKPLAVSATRPATRTGRKSLPSPQYGMNGAAVPSKVAPAAATTASPTRTRRRDRTTPTAAPAPPAG